MMFPFLNHWWAGRQLPPRPGWAPSEVCPRRSQESLSSAPCPLARVLSWPGWGRLSLSCRRLPCCRLAGLAETPGSRCWSQVLCWLVRDADLWGGPGQHQGRVSGWWPWLSHEGNICAARFMAQRENQVSGDCPETDMQTLMSLPSSARTRIQQNTAQQALGNL